MKIERTTVVKLYLSKLENLDPVSVMLEDFCPGQGQITITCYGKAWTAYWGAIGADRTISQFFCDCDNGYILKNMLTRTHRTDFDKINRESHKKGFDLCVSDDFEVAMAAEDMAECFGRDWYMEIPKCHTNEYCYLSRIIDVVKEALKTKNIKAVCQ